MPVNQATIDEAIKLGDISILGDPSLFKVDQVSYYPAERRRRWYHGLLGLDHKLGPRLTHHPAEGYLELFEEPVKGVYRGRLRLESLEKKPTQPERVLSAIPGRAIGNHYHTVTDVKLDNFSGNTISFYTTDRQGSKWSIHCGKAD